MEVPNNSLTGSTFAADLNSLKSLDLILADLDKYMPYLDGTVDFNRQLALIDSQNQYNSKEAALAYDRDQALMNASFAFNASEAEKARQYNSVEAEKARLFNKAEAEINRQWQEQMSNTAYQRMVADATAAGLNPYLAYSLGGASVTSGSAASGSAASVSPASGSALSAPAARAASASVASNQLIDLAINGINNAYNADLKDKDNYNDSFNTWVNVIGGILRTGLAIAVHAALL